jgi:glycosyltransferase involved in cell wall biosynthesis
MKISIITACFNSEKTIEDTIKSVLSQTWSDYEHIIVDGKSSDKTLEIVEKYKNSYNGRLKIISEKDNGLYDAMNKGLKFASGDIIGILNSDDIYANDHVLETIINVFDATNCDGTYSDLEFKDYETMQITQRTFIAKRGSYHTGWHPPHPTLYLKRDVYSKIGNFNLNYKISADFDFMLRMLLDKSIKLTYIKQVLIHMRTGGTSTANFKSYANSLSEAHKSLKMNHVKFKLFADTCRIFRFAMQIVFK